MTLLADVEVANAATVAELKQAVEAVFSHVPQKGPGKILWLVFINYVTNVSEYICNFTNLILESL